MEHPLPDTEKVVRDTLLNLHYGHLLRFDKGKIRYYAPANPSEEDGSKEYGLEASTLDLHSPPTYKNIELASYPSLSAVPTDITEYEREAQKFEHAPIVFEDDSPIDAPISTDVDHLVPERKARGEIFIQELQQYAKRYIEERTKPSLDERYVCVNHKKDYGWGVDICEQCGGAEPEGSIPKYPVITLVNEETKEKNIFPVDVAQLLADSALPIQWQDRDENDDLLLSVRTEGFIVDVSALLKARFSEIGIDWDAAFEYSLNQPGAYRVYHRKTLPIDESSIIPDVIEALQYDISRHLQHETYHALEMHFKNIQPTHESLAELRGIVEAHGYTLAYTQVFRTHRLHYDNETKHTFLAMDRNGKAIELVPKSQEQLLIGVFHDFDGRNLDLAIEDAILAVRTFGIGCLDDTAL